MAEPSPSAHKLAVIAAVLVGLFATYQAVATEFQRDFFIFRLGSELAARGQNPYDIATVRGPIAAHFTDDEAKEFRENCGYFLPPMAILEFMPFAMLPWVAAKVAWGLVLALAAYFIARLPGLWEAPRPPLPAGAQPPSSLLRIGVPFLLTLNFVALGSVLIGQYTVLFVGSVAAGLLAFERGRPYLAAAVWVLPFVKPHLALPLVPLAWYLGGWRPAALLVLIVGTLNVIGATVVGGSPLFLRDYLNFLPQAREAVLYNRVEWNPAILSWNRLLYAITSTEAPDGKVTSPGVLVELSAAGIIAGYLVVAGILVGRCAIAKVKPSTAWVVAATAIAGPLCAQVLVYESLYLLVAVPWVRDLFRGGFRVRAWLAVGLMAIHTLPPGPMTNLGLAMYHPLAVALLAVLVFTGPVTPLTPPASSGSAS